MCPLYTNYTILYQHRKKSYLKIIKLMQISTLDLHIKNYYKGQSCYTIVSHGR